MKTPKRILIMGLPGAGKITNITYGRDVGYKIEKEEFDSAVTSISATAIRKSMGLQ